MSESQEKSIKERLRTISEERDITFAQLWQNLILERFLVRLHRSARKDHFVFKGGSLLARYIDLGRETRDLDFLMEGISNAVASINTAIDEICTIDLKDAFYFERIKTDPLTHPHMHYTGVQVILQARFGKTRTPLQIDLGFGDIVEPIDHAIALTATRKGPFFESQIKLRCYPKEFIFAEKLETVVYRGGTNSRMKDFHDLYSLVSLPDCLNPVYAENVILNVFRHRNSPVSLLPLRFDVASIAKLQSLWNNYLKELKSTSSLPSSFHEVVSKINGWLSVNTSLWHTDGTV